MLFGDPRPIYMLIDDLFAQQMIPDGEQRGVLEVGLIIT